MSAPTEKLTTPGPVIMAHMEQGSREWLEARIGCVTMSNAAKLLVGGNGLTKLQYIIDVASEIVSGMPADQVNTWAMRRGTILEPYARQAYETVTGSEVRQVGLGYLNADLRISASPDGLLPDRGLEIKCQGAKAHMRTIIDAKNPTKFEAQIQGGMWVFDRDTWDYSSFCPEFKAMPLFIHTVHRDEEMIKRISDASFEAVSKADEYVSLMRANQVTEGVDIICLQAMETLSIIQGYEEEIM